LFERHGLSGHPAPRRETGQGTPAFASIGAGEYGAGVGSLRAKGADCGGGSETLIAHSLRAEGFDAGEDGTGRGTPLVPVAAIQERAICENPDAGPDGAGFRTDGVAYTLEARTVPQAIAFTGGASDIITREAIAFDTTQITSAANYSNPRPGDPCRPLAAGAHAPAVAFNLRGREGGAQPEADPDNLAVMRAASGGSSRSYLAFAQNSRDEVRLHGGDGQSVGALAAEPGMKQTCYVAFTAKDHGGDAMEDCSPTLRAGGHSRSHANAGVMPAVCLGGNAETMYGVSHGTTSETNTVEALRALRGAVGEEAYSEWCLGILAAFWPQEVLRSGLYGKGLRQPPQPKRGLVNVALSRSQIGSGWSVRDLWEAGCDGCPPQGWRPSEQLAGQLGSYLSRLPYSPSPAERFVQHLWEADEGPGILRYALSKVQEIRRSIVGQGQPVLPDQDGSGEEPDQDMQDDGLRQDRPCSRPLRDARHATAQVRRLVVEECEALQGFPRSYTLVPYRGGMMADGPRYKCLGNSMAVPVVRWIGQRILMVEALGAVEQAVAA
jgi:hypothetical protein